MKYKGICKEYGKTVDEEYSFGYALSRILENEEEKQAFLEWYYSGNWTTEEEDEM